MSKRYFRLTLGAPPDEVEFVFKEGEPAFLAIEAIISGPIGTAAGALIAETLKTCAPIPVTWHPLQPPHEEEGGSKQPDRERGME